MKGNIRKKCSTSFFTYCYIYVNIRVDGDYMDREEDLTRVFDKSWKANHNDDVKRAREKDRDFMNMMFSINNNKVNNRALTPGEMVSNLHNNMENVNRGINQSKINRIVGKFK